MVLIVMVGQMLRRQAEWHMNPERHRNSGLFRLRQSIATTLVMLTYVAAMSCAIAQTGKLSADRQAAIEGAISKFMAASNTPGVSAAVVQDGEFVWSAGFGMADLENSVPATSETLYRLGSISKPITATAAMELWERGKLDLDAPVQKYCPAFPQKPWPITTRQLLGHLGGIRYYNVPEVPYSVSQADPEVGNTRHFENGIEGGLKFFANDPLVAQPGTHFNYSTQGYTLVGCAIEGASGETYADYVRENVLIPAGMLQTRPDDRFAIIPRRTRFYSKDESGATVNAEFLDSSYKVPGGGLLSSASDMARFEVAILTDRLVKNATRDMMWTPQMPSDGLGRMVYGLGWQLGATDDVKDVGHGGGQQGTSTMMLIAPDARAGVVVLTNSDASGASGLATQLMRIVLGLPEHVHKEIAVDPKLLDNYLGTYQSGDFNMVIAREGDRLVAQVGDQRIPLSPETTRDFFPKGSDIHIIFVTDGNGRATELILRQGGFDLYAHRNE
jgi:CubicO group peptidase (beta-lactamase class C family)